MEKIELFNNDVSGYVLKFIPNTKKWQIHSSKYGAFEGDLLQIWQTMVFHYEMPNGDIRHAIKEMKEKSHNVAYFGVLGGFLFTSRK